MNLTKEKMEHVDLLLSILQRAAVILAILVGGAVFFLRLDHTPIVKFSLDKIGIDQCNVMYRFSAENVGEFPFTLAEVVVKFPGGTEGDHLTRDSIKQVAASGETIALVLTHPVSKAWENRIIEQKVSVRLKEDSGKWRIFDTVESFGKIPSECSS